MSLGSFLRSLVSWLPFVNIDSNVYNAARDAENITSAAETVGDVSSSGEDQNKPETNTEEKKEE